MDKRDRDAQRGDIDTILEVNKKAIELHTEISDQYEEIIATQNKMIASQTKIDDDIKAIKKDMDELNKSQFKIILLLSTGIISLIIQLVAAFRH
jgi:predicted  nucleic acid-binding Zn-ribbon protein